MWQRWSNRKNLSETFCHSVMFNTFTQVQVAACGSPLVLLGLTDWWLTGWCLAIKQMQTVQDLLLGLFMAFVAQQSIFCFITLLYLSLLSPMGQYPLHLIVVASFLTLSKGICELPKGINTWTSGREYVYVIIDKGRVNGSCLLSIIYCFVSVSSEPQRKPRLAFDKCSGVLIPVWCYSFSYDTSACPLMTFQPLLPSLNWCRFTD